MERFRKLNAGYIYDLVKPICDVDHGFDDDRGNWNDDDLSFFLRVVCGSPPSGVRVQRGSSDAALLSQQSIKDRNKLESKYDNI